MPTKVVDSMGETILAARGVSKVFDGGQTRALQNVDFTLQCGEIRGLIGENGSGKSTLCNIISGIKSLDVGTLEKAGEPYHPKSMVDAQAKGVSMIVQEMGTIPGIGIADNMFVGKESNYLKFGLVNRRAMVADAKKALAGIGVTDIDPGHKIDELSFEDRKLVEVARAMFDDPDVLIVDETTTALSQRGRDIIYNLCRRFRDEGRAVIFISHDLDEIMDICTDLTVLRDGELIGTLSREEMEPELIKSMMVGREMTGHYYRGEWDGSHGEAVTLRLENVTDTSILNGVSLELHEGEILGIGGLTESGIHEVGRAAFGLQPLVAGGVTLADGTHVNHPSTATKHRMGYLSKNRDKEALMVSASILDNFVLPSLKDLRKGGLVTLKAEKKLALEMAELMQVKYADIQQPVSDLSGGNKQKIVFGKWLGNKSRIIILDCPTRGVDVGVKQAMYQLIYKLKQEGCSILLISEELAELIGMSDRILIMRDGAIASEHQRSESLSEHDLIKTMI